MSAYWWGGSLVLISLGTTHKVVLIYNIGYTSPVVKQEVVCPTLYRIHSTSEAIFKSIVNAHFANNFITKMKCFR